MRFQGWGLKLYQASASCLFSLCRSKLFPTSFWQRMYLQRTQESGGGGTGARALHTKQTLWLKGPALREQEGAQLSHHSSAGSHFQVSWPLARLSS